ncbi:hypothetical protein E2C01_064118 [Portunus trituberculatus]|uniref:Uncharacterized protein n=1 Tax=Portunus trituberculatus TaxID=210409 RepID=A0A5B7HIW4_PORTR|nr:hypothetical protein [Portunus trituberculatus]
MPSYQSISLSNYLPPPPPHTAFLIKARHKQQGKRIRCRSLNTHNFCQAVVEARCVRAMQESPQRPAEHPHKTLESPDQESNHPLRSSGSQHTSTFIRYMEEIVVVVMVVVEEYEEDKRGYRLRRSRGWKET